MIQLDQVPQTNIVMIKVQESKISTSDFLSKLQKISEEEADQEEAVAIRANKISKGKLRLVTYQDITDEDIDAACRKLRQVIEGCDKYLI